MKKYEMTVIFDAVSANEAFARTVAAAFAARLDPSIEELTDIRTAVSEAVTNAIIHGYGNMGGKVNMHSEIEGDIFSIEVSDTGRGIENIEEAMQPFYTSAPELERSGMGFSVMQAFMDSVEVKSTVGSGTTVAMKKSIRASREDG